MAGTQGSDKFTNYYQVLQSDKNASFEELKRNYQRLLMSLHPDKVSVENADDASRFLLVQKAWSVLRDPNSRKLHDAELVSYEHDDLLLFDRIKLSEMEYDASGNVYSYLCRCGGSYLIDSCGFVEENVVIPCDECSFSIQVNIRDS